MCERPRVVGPERSMSDDDGPCAVRARMRSREDPHDEIFNGATESAGRRLALPSQAQIEAYHRRDRPGRTHARRGAHKDLTMVCSCEASLNILG